MWGAVKLKSAWGKKFFHALCVIALVAYSAILIWMAVTSRHEGYSKSVNLTLLSSYSFILRQYNSMDVFKQILDNIFVFIPLGIFLPAACNIKHETKNYVYVALTGLAVSVIIETLQYVFSLGFTEIDDVINNFWGCAIGCGIFALTGKAEAKKDSLVLKKGWFKCLIPLTSFIVIFGVIWCYREFILLQMT